MTRQNSPFSVNTAVERRLETLQSDVIPPLWHALCAKLMGYTPSRLSFIWHQREAAVCLAARPTALRGQTRVSAHQANNRWPGPVRLGHRALKRVDFQRLYGVCGSFSPAFRLVKLLEKVNIDVGGQFFCVFEYGVEGFDTAPFSLIATAAFCQSGGWLHYLALQQRWGTFWPAPSTAGSQTGALMAYWWPNKYSASVLLKRWTHATTRSTCSRWGQVKKLCLWIDWKALATSAVFSGQRLGFFVAAGNVDNDERVFVNFTTAGQLFMWQKKKVCLVDRVRRRYVEFRERDVAQRREIDLTKGLVDKPLLWSFFRGFHSFC